MSDPDSLADPRFAEAPWAKAASEFDMETANGTLRIEVRVTVYDGGRDLSREDRMALANAAGSGAVAAGRKRLMRRWRRALAAWRSFYGGGS